MPLATVLTPNLTELGPVAGTSGEDRELAAKLLLEAGADWVLVKGGHDDGVREAAAWATAHCPGRFTEAQWRRILQRRAATWQQRPGTVTESVLHGIAYGIGTDRHRALLAEIAADGRLPAVARTTAAWLNE